MSMKKRLRLAVLWLILVLGLCACRGIQGIDFKGTIDIPADGLVSTDVLKSLKDDNGVATFVGESNGYRYEWTVFGSDVTDASALNLRADITRLGEMAFTVTLFNRTATSPAILSVYQDCVWSAPSAVVYRDGEAVTSASITGSNVSIVNFSVSDLSGEYTVRADVPEDTDQSSTPAQESTPDKPASDDRKYSVGTQTERDKYQTDPIPEGKPLPVEPEDQTVDTAKRLTCIFSIECTTIFNHLSDLESGKLEVLPKDGVILPRQTVTFSEGESVYDVLQRVCRENGIHMEASWTPVYNSAYVEGIHNLYEFDCGSLSGWMYRVNGWYPNYGCSRYGLAQGDVVEWRYTCNLGKDVGCEWLADEANG